MSRNLTIQEKILIRIKKDKKRTLKHSIVMMVVLLLLMTSLTKLLKPSPIKAEKESTAILTATMVGDIMLGRNSEKVSERYGQEYVFRYVKPIFETSDFVSGNFEHPVVLRDGYKEADKYIHLKTNAESVETLKKLNFSVLTIANNHTMDFGKDGLEDTINTFNNEKLAFVGAGLNLEEASKISYTTTNGMVIGSIGITDAYVKEAKAQENMPGVLTADPAVVLPLISDARSKANLVIVNVHWGQEYDNEPSPRQKDLAKAMVDAGADIIIGHHPHVLSSIEVYKDSVIFYSLGNFVFDQGWSRTRDSAIVQYKLSRDGTARFEVTPLRIREASPSPLGKLSYLHEQKIFQILTKNTKGNQLWKQEDSKLVYELNHSHVLKGVVLDGE